MSRGGDYIGIRKIYSFFNLSVEILKLFTNFAMQTALQNPGLG